MHLTNYAVNKRNSAFHQPTAAGDSPDDQQQDASKRTLHWFANWVAERYGQGKVDALYSRIGE